MKHWNMDCINSNKRYRVIAGNRGGYMNRIDRIVYGDEVVREMKENMRLEVRLAQCKSIGEPEGEPEGDAVEDVAKKYAKMIDDYIYHRLIDEGDLVQVASAEEAIEKGYRVLLCNAEMRHRLLSDGFTIRMLVYNDIPNDLLYVFTDKATEDVVFKNLDWWEFQKALGKEKGEA